MKCYHGKRKRYPQCHNISRRSFLSTMGAATGGLLLGGLGNIPSVAGNSIKTNSQVARAYLASYDRLLIRDTIEAMFNNLGGLGDIIKSGDTVGIKLNLTGGDSDASSVQNQTGLTAGETFWTHPEILRAVGELIIDAGASEIYVLEAIYDWESYQDWGYEEVTNYLGGQFIDLNQKTPYQDYAIRPVGDTFNIYETLTQNGIFNDLDCLVSLAKSKRHVSAGITHGIKNLVGTLPLPAGLYNNGQGWRAAIHSNESNDGNSYSNLCRVIMDLHSATPIQLVVNDAIKTVLGGEGPWVPDPLVPVNFDTLVCSKDPVAADAIATQALGFDPMAADLNEPFPLSLNYLKLATELGMGNYDLNNIDIIETPTFINRFRTSQAIPQLQLKNFPNPFNSETVFEMSLAQSGYSTLDIYNMRGQRVRRLLARSLPAGQSKINWSGRNDRGKLVPSGVYLSVLNTNGHKKIHKISLLK